MVGRWWWSCPHSSRAMGQRRGDSGRDTRHRGGSPGRLQVGVLALECVVGVRVPNVPRLLGLMLRGPGLEEVFEVSVLVGQVPAFDIGFDGKLRDVESAGRAAGSTGRMVPAPPARPVPSMAVITRLANNSQLRTNERHLRSCRSAGVAAPLYSVRLPSGRRRRLPGGRWSGPYRSGRRAHRP